MPNDASPGYEKYYLQKEYSEYLEYPKGDPREPMTEEDLDNKFAALSEGLFNENVMKDIKNDIYNCELLSVSEFMEKIVL